MTLLVTQATFAKICNTTRKTVTVWKQRKHLILVGNLVDVAATNDHMKRFHPGGSPIVLSPLEIADLIAEGGNRGSSRKGGGNNSAVTLDAPVTPRADSATTLMTVGDLEAQLVSLDWTQDFDWSPEAEDERVRRAAQCIGWEAVTSLIVDDSHWDGYQLRIPKYMEDGLHEGAIAGGFGYEFDAFQVLSTIREHISIRRDEDGGVVQTDDDQIEVQSHLIHLLARPFGEMHTRKS
ncbi:hypothetical protein [Paraburkholderia sp.]|uniref:hypothetical protein n=1 Tax=Paraburkholderia sp. TaxID=1926495 RepID=UPI003C7BA60C